MIKPLSRTSKPHGTAAQPAPGFDPGRLSSWGLLRRYALISGMGMTVLGGVAYPRAAQAAPMFGSAAWFAQQNTQRLSGSSAIAPRSSSTGSTGSTSGPGAVVTPQQALQRAQQSMTDLTRALQAIQSAQAAQQLAASSALNNGKNNLGTTANPLLDVPNGLGKGGLQIYGSTDSNPGTPVQGSTLPDGTPVLTGVKSVTQSASGANGATTVTVSQDAQKAILTWQTFNVGKQTTLNFDQSGGNQSNGSNNWVALNRVLDTSANPSQILGSIKAQGDVYIINPNGIIFGGSSQVNTHSLIASSLSFLGDDNCLTSCAASNAQFLNQGFNQQGPMLGARTGIAATQISGGITIDAGASITTGELGYSLIAAPVVNNAGSIKAADGQAILAAGVGVTLASDPTVSLNLGLGLTGLVAQGGSTPVGSLVNTGLIQSQRGNITLLGYQVQQNGVVVATTGVSRPGGITIVAGDEYDGNVGNNRFGPLSLASGSVTALLPEEDGQTTTSSTAASTAFQPGQITLQGNYITIGGTAGTVGTVGNGGALLEAPGQNVTISALGAGSVPPTEFDTGVAGRVYLASDATIDVSGLANVELSVADTLVTIPRVGLNELADSPLLRDGFLYGQSVTVDSSLSGTRGDGLGWIGSPIVDATAYVQNVPRKIDQLLQAGGTISLKGNEVITRKGSVLDLDGGYISYLGGMVGGTTKLLGANGQIYDISTADPNVQYLGFAGQFSVSHPRWGVTDTYVDPLMSGATSHYESGFIQGGKAGTLAISSDATVLDGALSAQAYAGRNQVASGSRPSGGAFSIGVYQGAGAQNFTINGGSAADPLQSLNLGALDPAFGAGTTLQSVQALAAATDPAVNDPANSRDFLSWTPLSAPQLDAAGFSSIKVTALGQVLVEAGSASRPVNLQVQPLGSISLTGVSATILGDLTAHSGSIKVVAGEQLTPDGTVVGPVTGNVTVGSGATLDTSGLWVNDTGLGADQLTGSQYKNGGSISLSTTLAGGGTNGDGSGSIFLESDANSAATLDVRSGGYVQPSGKLLTRNGLVQGTGGSISLLTYTGSAFGTYPNSEVIAPSSLGTSGRIQFGGSKSNAPVVNVLGGNDGMGGPQVQLLGEGFAGGGTLTVQSLGFQVGGDSAKTPSWGIYVPTEFFASHGFGSYAFDAEYDATISGTVKLTQQNLLPNLAQLAKAPTGSTVDALLVGGATTLGQQDPYYRQPTNLRVTAGGYLYWRANAEDAGFSIPFAPPNYDGVSGTVRLDSGAVLQADAGATVELGSAGLVAILGKVSAPGGTIILDGRTASGEPANPQGHINDLSTSTPAANIWLATGAVLDASANAASTSADYGGGVLINPLAPAVDIGGQNVVPRTGKVLDGGSVQLYGENLIAESGSTIDVSGTSTSTSFQLPQSMQGGTPGRPGVIYADTPVWSNGGQIVLGAGNSLYFDGTLLALPGAASGSGGSLTIAPNSYGNGGGATHAVATPYNNYLNDADNLILLAGTPTMAPAQEPAAGNVISPNGTLYFAVGRLDGSGIASFNINTINDYSTPSKSADSPSTPAPLTLGFSGDVSLSLMQSFSAVASQYVALPAGSMSIPPAQAGTSTTAGKVTIDAPYVSLAGYYNNVNDPLDPNNAQGFKPTVAIGSGTLSVNAAFIDLSGEFGLQNFANANFSSSGDIRFYTPGDLVFHNAAGTASPGVLYSSGNLNFTAAQLYPASGNVFIVDAAGPQDTKVSIGQFSAAPSSTPLSVGGSLLIDATAIVQSGTIRAPDGSIVLGVGNAGDAATQAAFHGLPLDATQSVQQALPLVATQSVTLAPGSITSVSLDGAILPYGTTVDGTEWQYNPVNPSGQTLPNLTAPPAKRIALNGVSVTLDQGATVDLSGGGDLQAQEWVPGTGGSRNVLAQSSISYANSTSGTSIPLYADKRPIYAIVPGYSAPVAAYDPATASSGTSVGQSVYLSGAPGLPAGWYTLLPASYATLPGAFRVVQDTSAVDTVSSQNTVLPDGTAVVAGYFGNALSGARASRSTSFEVQSGPVWQQYSQFTLSSANTFFQAQAAHAGNAVPQLPRDAGQLVLGASGGLTLGDGSGSASGSPILLTAGADVGAAAQIDIASQDIQIVGGGGSGETPLSGYIQLSAQELDGLHAGSLLIGGTRSQTSGGVTINALANSIVVSNDDKAPLQGPEIILVTKTDPNQTDPNWSNSQASYASTYGLHVDSGSVIRASGTLPASADKPISIAGDGALLRVSNAAAVPFTRSGTSGQSVSGSARGLLDVQARATITGGQALTLDSSQDTVVDPAAVFSGQNIVADGGAVTFVSGNNAPGGVSGLVIGDATLQQFAGAQQVTLRSYGSIDFEGDVKVTVPNSLTLSAGAFTAGADGQAGQVSISAGTLALTNQLNAAAPAGAGGAGSLSLKAAEIDFGTTGTTVQSTTSFSGFGSVTVTANGGIVGRGAAAFDFGGDPLTFSAPLIVAATGANTSLKTTGAFVLDSSSGTPLSVDALGGALSLTGGSIKDSALIEAPAGKLTLDALSGDLTLVSGGTLSAAGLAKQFYDVTEYAPGGAILLKAGSGSVNLMAGSTVDFSAASGGGNAGSLSITAPKQTAVTAGTIKGGAAADNQGGSFSEDVGGAVDLNALAATLAGSGVSYGIGVHSRSGDLVLAGNSLTAQNVYLAADGGTVTIGPGSVIDADGGTGSDGLQQAGGSISLYGGSGVDVEGTLTARTGNASQRGGTVNIGTGILGIDSGTNAVNSTYGYENVTASGKIVIGANAVIDVTGGSAGGLSNGTVNFRAPLLEDGSVNFTNASKITGARDVGLEAYAVWSTADASTGTQHFDGIIDPAGWYDQNGKLLRGKFTSPTPGGRATGDLTKDYFTPTKRNADHLGFYQNTLVSFVENLGGAAVQFAGVTVRPGIELDNPLSAGVNGGNISLLSNWNLGATDSTGAAVYRYNANGQAPVLTLRAGNNLQLDASLTDGFFQTGNPFGASSKIDNGISPNSPSLQAANLMSVQDPAGLIGGSSSYRLVAGADPGSADPLAVLDMTGPDPSNASPGSGNVTVDGHFSLVPSRTSRTIELPTLVRTGTGFIDIAAGNDFALLDTVAPGAVYTAGAPVPGTTQGFGVKTFKPISGTAATYVVTGTVNPEAAGDLVVDARNNVIGVENVTDSSNVTNTPGAYLGQFWLPWMELGNSPTQSSINFGGFDQGLLSAGGNVSVLAGGDVRDLSVSLPTTYSITTASDGTQQLSTYGGGNLRLSAGGDILSGDYFVSRGYGSIEAGGRIGSDFSFTPVATGVPMQVSTLLALQDAMMQVNARGSEDIGGVFNPSYLEDGSTVVLLPSGTNSLRSFDSQSYSARSALSIASAGGDLVFDSLAIPDALFDYGTVAAGGNSRVLPASLALTALDGGIAIEGSGELYPSSSGQLSVVAQGDVSLFNAVDQTRYFGLIDAPAAQLPSPTNPLSNKKLITDYISGVATALHQSALHADDTQPALIYSLGGDIVDGVLAGNGFIHDELIVAPDKPAQVRAAQDIVDLVFLGQNLRDADLTSIIAGHDIYDRPLGLIPGDTGYTIVPSLLLGGPGNFDIEAGRDIGPLTSQAILGNGTAFPFSTNGGIARATGIQSIGNAVNPYLPHQSASIEVLFGIGPGLDQAAFTSRYIDPANAGSVAGVPSFVPDLVSFMEQYLQGQVVDTGLPSGNTATLSPQQAWTMYQTLPQAQQRLFEEQVFFKILALTGTDYNDPASPYFHQYGRGYQAINTLFPASLGYTANNLSGGNNGASQSQIIHTGDLDIRSSTIQTQEGGNISIFGPGGQALIGSTSAPPVISHVDPSGQVVVDAGPNTQGILTLEKGSVDIFLDRSLLLAQSRVFTEQGGDMVIWSSNGDINAGKGAKSTSEIPPPSYLCDQDHYCLIDAKGQVSGAGIATLQTVPGAAAGSVFLIAPRGTVDAGEAGIRVSGNLFVAAQAVANASNIQVSGNKVGVPVTVHVDAGSLSAANAAAAAAEQSATPNGNSAQNAASLITVEVVGLGSPDEEEKKRLRGKPKGEGI